MEMDIATAFLFLVFCFALGDLISTKTNALVPSILVAAVLFIVGYWTFWPENISEISALGNTLGGLSSYLIIVNMGTSISVKQLFKSWKTMAVALGAMIGLTAVILLIGTPTIGRQASLVASPVLAGGLISALIMQEAALDLGLTALGSLAILLFVIQGFVGYPLTAIVLRKEGQSLIEKYRKLPVEQRKDLLIDDAEKRGESKKLFPRIPEKYLSSNIYLLQAALLSFISVKIASFSNGLLPAAVACLLVGVIAAEIGLVEPKPVEKSNSMGFLLLALLVYVLSGLSAATPEMVLSMIVPLLVVVVAGLTGLVLVVVPLGKALGYSWAYSIALGLNCLLGFPPNMIITNDVASSLAENKEEEAYLNDAMLPDMLIAGFVTVTIGSVVLAGIFANML